MPHKHKKVKEKQKWLVLNDEGWKIIIPDTDIKPHGFPEGGLKTELAGRNCPCKPKIDWADQMIIHNSFEQKKAIDEAILKNLPPNKKKQ